MKIHLTLGHLSNQPFMRGFDKLCEHPWKGDVMAHLIEADSLIEAKTKVINTARQNLIKKYGEKRDEDWVIVPKNTAGIGLFVKRMEELQKVPFTIRLVSVLKVPDGMELTVRERRALQDAGIIEPLPAPKPDPADPSEASDPADPSDPLSAPETPEIPGGAEAGPEDKDPSPAALGAAAPACPEPAEGRPAQLPPPARNGAVKAARKIKSPSKFLTPFNPQP